MQSAMCDTCGCRSEAEIAALLVPHARREEHGLFAELVAEGVGSGYVVRLEHEPISRCKY